MAAAFAFNLEQMQPAKVGAATSTTARTLDAVRVRTVQTALAAISPVPDGVALDTAQATPAVVSAGSALPVIL